MSRYLDGGEMPVVRVDFSKSRCRALRRLNHTYQVVDRRGSAARYFNQFLREKCSSWRDNTTRTYAGHLDRFGSWLLAKKIEVFGVDGDLLDEFALCLASNRSLRPQTCIDALGAIQRFMHWAVDKHPDLFEEFEHQSPVALYASAETRQTLLPHKNSGEPRFIQNWAADKFIAELGLDAAHGPRNQLLARLMREAGLRVSEATSFPLSALPDLQRYGESVIVSICGKGGRVRFVVIPWSLHKDLLEYASLERKNILEHFRPRCMPQQLFLSAQGEALSTARVQAIFRATSKRAGLKATPHQLRHTFATYYYLEHKDLAGLNKLLGHALLETTQIYVGFEKLAVHSDELRRQLIDWERPIESRNLPS